MDNAPAKPENSIQTALAAGRQLATQPIKSPLQDGMPFIALRGVDGGERLEFIDERFDIPHRKFGTVKLDDEKSFMAYWQAQCLPTSTIFANADDSKFIAIFNDHAKNDGAADWRDHRAVFELGFSDEWDQWTARNAKRFDGNAAFAEWLEDNLPDIVDPPGAAMLELALNLKVTANASYAKALRLADGDTQLTYTNSVEGTARTESGQIRIPDHFRINIPVHQGIDAPRYNIDARFRFRLNGPTLSIWYELVRPHKVLEQAFNDIIKRIEEGAKTTVLFGSPE